MAVAQLLCKTSDLDSFGSKGLTISLNGKAEDIFVVRKEKDYFAYINECPHRLTQLEWNPDQFLSADSEHIICSMHAALFTIDKGLCVDGPCVGKSLKSIKIQLIGKKIYLVL